MSHCMQNLKKRMCKGALARVWIGIDVLVILVIAYILVYFESDYLWKAQELNLFLDTPEFLTQQMAAPGWLITWLGSLCTALFYEPWMGVGLLTVWWWGLLFLMNKAFRIPADRGGLLLVPITAILMTIVGLGYWIYYMGTVGHLYGATIGTTVAVAAAWLYCMTPALPWFRSVFILASTAMLYILIGCYGLLATLLMGILTWRMQDMSISGRLWTIGVVSLANIAWPLICYNYIYCQTNIEDIYMVGLPVFYQGQNYPVYYAPYWMLAFSLAMMAAAYKPDRMPSSSRHPIWVGLQTILLVVLMITVHHYWYKDYNFHQELRMQRLLENQDWERLVEVAASQEEEPTHAIVMMRNLALFRLGRQGDEMYHFRSGNKAYATNLPMPLSRMLAHIIYYHYGQLNYSARWCMEEAMETNWRAMHLKYLIRCALANGEDDVARKYVDILKHSAFHRRWAIRHEKFLYRHEMVSNDREFANVLNLSKSDDMLGNDYARIELFLMHQFAYQESDNKVFQEQSVISAMWTRMPQLFWPHFFRFVDSHPEEHLPIHFQEAALLFAHLQNITDISRIRFDKKVVDNYDEFVQLFQRYDGISLERMRRVLYPRFGQTYYYEYFMNQPPPQY